MKNGRGMSTHQDLCGLGRQLNQEEVLGTMDSDQLISYVLQNRLYDVNIETGEVIGKRGKKLAAPCDQDGYQAVTLFLSRRLQRTAHVHRMVAIKVLGPVAIKDKQVAHRDRVRTHNTFGNLWIPDSVKMHNIYDGTINNLLLGQRKCKENWLPCVRCGDTGGPPFYGRKTPARVTGARFGFTGDLCWHCYHALDERERRLRRKIA